MIDKIVPSAAAAVADIPDGATVMIGGFGTAGMPSELIDALIEQGARELTIVNNNAGNGDIGLAALLKAKRVRKILCSFPRQVDSYVIAPRARISLSCCCQESAGREASKSEMCLLVSSSIVNPVKRQAASLA